MKSCRSLSKRAVFVVVVALLSALAPVSFGLANEALFDRTLARVASEEKAIGQLYKVLPAPLFNALKMDAEKRLATMPPDKANEEAEWLVVTVADLLQNGSGEKMPTNSAADYGVDNLPNFLALFIGYEKQYPNLASIARLAEATKRHAEATKRHAEATKNLEQAKRLNQMLGGSAK